MEEAKKVLRALETIHWQYLPLSRVLEAMVLGVPKNSAHHHLFVHLPREAQRVGQKLASEEVNLDILAERVLQEAWRRMEAPLSALWGLLGMRSCTEVEEALRKGYWLKAYCYRPSWGRPGTVKVEVTGKTWAFYHQLPNRYCPEFSLEAWGGRVDVSTLLGSSFVRTGPFCTPPTSRG